jgi:hypothetical protein
VGAPACWGRCAGQGAARPALVCMQGVQGWPGSTHHVLRARVTGQPHRVVRWWRFAWECASRSPELPLVRPRISRTPPRPVEQSRELLALAPCIIECLCRFGDIVSLIPHCLKDACPSGAGPRSARLQDIVRTGTPGTRLTSSSRPPSDVHFACPPLSHQNPSPCLSTRTRDGQSWPGLSSAPQVCPCAHGHLDFDDMSRDDPAHHRGVDRRSGG